MTTQEELDCSEAFAAIDYEDCTGTWWSPQLMRMWVFTNCSVSCAMFRDEGVVRWCPDVWAPKETRKAWQVQHATA